MTAVIGPLNQPSRWCSWHYDVKDHPDLQDNYEEFERWRDVWKDYCFAFTHYPITWLWDWVHGKESGQPWAPRPCQKRQCSFRPADDPMWLDMAGFRKRQDENRRKWLRDLIERGAPIPSRWTELAAEVARGLGRPTLRVVRGADEVRDAEDR